MNNFEGASTPPEDEEITESEKIEATDGSEKPLTYKEKTERFEKLMEELRASVNGYEEKFEGVLNSIPSPEELSERYTSQVNSPTDALSGAKLTAQLMLLKVDMLYQYKEFARRKSNLIDNSSRSKQDAFTFFNVLPSEGSISKILEGMPHSIKNEGILGNNLNALIADEASIFSKLKELKDLDISPRIADMAYES